MRGREIAMEIRSATWDEDEQAIREVRTAVFVEEQEVPVELDFDGLDGSSLHVLAVAPDGRSVGTARMLEDGHIGRMAVLKEWRGRGVGTRMLEALLAQAVGMGLRCVFLHSQDHAVPFYARLGFVKVGDCFMDAGIPHYRMDKTLPEADD